MYAVMTADDRRRLGRRLLKEQNSRFKGNAKAAYTAADVTQATWKNATQMRPMTEGKLRQIVANLWPAVEGDIDRIPGIEPPTDPYEALLDEVDRSELSKPSKDTMRKIIESERQGNPPPDNRRRNPPPDNRRRPPA